MLADDGGDTDGDDDDINKLASIINDNHFPCGILQIAENQL